MKTFFGPQWAKQAFFYEIYPQSFCDSNGDGIGDLPGIIAKLDYVQSLHANAIWLNPCFESPFRDAGYDISNYYKIAPRYGTNDDLKRLFQEAHKRGIHVILDLVPGHTSNAHPYFQASASAQKTEYDNFYIWTTDWLQPTGPHHFISGTEKRNGYYMVNFFAHQPALNYGFDPVDPQYPWQLPVNHPDVQRVRQELRNVMKFYLDMGCDGFRVDMAASLVRGANAATGIQELWQQYRHWLDQNYPQAFLIAEWGLPSQAIPAGFHADFMLHNNAPGYSELLRTEERRFGCHCEFGLPAPSFFDKTPGGDAYDYLHEIQKYLAVLKGNGYIGITSGNHDLGRIRALRDIEELKAIYAFLFLLPGIPFLYYGDEIGMENIEGLGNHEGSYNRSSSRTPMQWDGSPNAGFSSADPSQFYLPLDPSPNRPDVATQEKDSGSLLHFVRNLMDFRAGHPAAHPDAGFDILYCQPHEAPAVYRRFQDGRQIVVAVNPPDRPRQIFLPLEDAGKLHPHFQGGEVSLEILPGATRLYMGPSSYAVWES